MHNNKTEYIYLKSLFLYKNFSLHEFLYILRLLQCSWSFLFRVEKRELSRWRDNIQAQQSSIDHDDENYVSSIPREIYQVFERTRRIKKKKYKTK